LSTMFEIKELLLLLLLLLLWGPKYTVGCCAPYTPNSGKISYPRSLLDSI